MMQRLRAQTQGEISIREIVVEEPERTKRAGRNILSIVVGCTLFLLTSWLASLILLGPGPWSQNRLIQLLTSLIGFGVSLTSLLDGMKSERQRLRLSKEGIVAEYQSVFRRTEKTYPSDDIGSTFVELCGSTARGGITFQSGHALLFCSGNREEAMEIARRASALWSLPEPRYVLVNRPARSVTRHNAAVEDGPFHLLAYPHSYWDVPHRMFRLVSIGGATRTITFDAIVGIAVVPAGVGIDPAYPCSSTKVSLHLASGERITLTTIVRPREKGVLFARQESIDPALRDARLLQSILVEWTGASVESS